MWIDLRKKDNKMVNFFLDGGFRYVRLKNIYLYVFFLFFNNVCFFMLILKLRVFCF